MTSCNALIRTISHPQERHSYLFYLSLSTRKKADFSALVTIRLLITILDTLSILMPEHPYVNVTMIRIQSRKHYEHTRALLSKPRIRRGASLNFCKIGELNDRRRGGEGGKENLRPLRPKNALFVSPQACRPVNFEDKVQTIHISSLKSHLGITSYA